MYRKYHLFIEFDDPVRWNDKVGMLTERTQLINAVCSETTALGVVRSLAPRTTDGNYFLHSNSKVKSPPPAIVHTKPLYVLIHFINYKSKNINYKIPNTTTTIITPTSSITTVMVFGPETNPISLFIFLLLGRHSSTRKPS